MKYKSIICPVCKKIFSIYINDYRLKNGFNLYCSKECSNNARKTGKTIKCKQCNKDFYTTRNEFCSQKCARIYKKEHYNHKIYMENGYAVRYIDGYNKKGNVKEHRYIMEQYLGRKLNNNEIVHHKDGNKLNNNIDNLEVMLRGEHSRMHRKEEIKKGKKLFGK